VRKFLVIAALTILSVLLLFLVCGIFVPALDRRLLWPGFRAAKALGISEEGGKYAVVGIGVAWTLWAAVFAALITAIKNTIWHRRELLVACAAAVCVILVFQARGRHNREYDGTWEVVFDRSDFHYGCACWHLPYLLEPTAELSSRLDALGNPPAVKLKFIGDTTSIGSYGHLGQYLREIRVVRIIDVQKAQPSVRPLPPKYLESRIIGVVSVFRSNLAPFSSNSFCWQWVAP
jgi:hypothetical protein